MAQRLFAALTRAVADHRRLLIFGSGSLALALVIAGVTAAVTPTPAACEGLCQCWYCPSYEWVWNPELGRAEPQCLSACDHGCVGACNSSADCSQVPGQGGCGPVCSCRSEDCQAEPVATSAPPTPVATPTPPPIPSGCPAPDEVREWTHIMPPTIGDPAYRPEHPIVVGQDPDQRGFDLHLVFTGGRYEYKTQRLERWCGPASAGESNGRYPAACGAEAEWHYECPIRCTECYDDPLASAQVRMRLADETLAWFRDDLAVRFPGAAPREGLPKIWQIAGLTDQMHYDAWWRYAPGRPDVLSPGPVDPGTHGGQIWLWTKGTPKSPPQLVKGPFTVDVALADTTIWQ